MLRTPNRILWAVLRPLARLIARLKLNFTAAVFRTQGPFVLLCNHASWYDALLASLCVNQPLCFAGGDRPPRRGFLLRLARLLQQPEGMSADEALRQAAEQGKCLGLFPEGTRCTDGVTGPIPPDLAEKIRASGLGLVTLRITGAYFAAPRWSDGEPRKGRIRARVMRSLTPGVLQALEDSELQELIERDLREDACASARKRPVPYRGERLAEHLETLLDLCPKCGSVGRMQSRDDELSCAGCGFSTRLTRTGAFRGGGVPFADLREWRRWQDERIALLCSRAGEELIFEDEGCELYALRDGREELVGRGGIHLYRDRLELPTGVSLPMGELRRLELTSGGGLLAESSRGSRFEVNSVRAFCAGKYITAWQALQETTTEE